MVRLPWKPPPSPPTKAKGCMQKKHLGRLNAPVSAVAPSHRGLVHRSHHPDDAPSVAATTVALATSALAGPPPYLMPPTISKLGARELPNRIVLGATRGIFKGYGPSFSACLDCFSLAYPRLVRTKGSKLHGLAYSRQLEVPHSLLALEIAAGFTKRSSYKTRSTSFSNPTKLSPRTRFRPYLPIEMTRKFTQKSRAVKPVPLSIPSFNIEETIAVQALVKIYLKSRDMAASSAQPGAQHHREKRATGKQRAKGNQPENEVRSRVASGSAPPTQRPIKRMRTFLSVEPSDRVLRSRQTPQRFVRQRWFHLRLRVLQQRTQTRSAHASAPAR